MSLKLVQLLGEKPTRGRPMSSEVNQSDFRSQQVFRFFKNEILPVTLLVKLATEQLLHLIIKTH